MPSEATTKPAAPPHESHEAEFRDSDLVGFTVAQCTLVADKFGLSGQERRVYFLCHTSCSTKEVAEWLHLSPAYVRKLRHSLGLRLGVKGGMREVRRLTAAMSRTA